MTIFDIGIKILFLLTILFFLVFFGICRNWAKPMHPERANLIGIFLSGLYSFWVFVGGLLVLVIIYLIWFLIWK